ncbi:MAG: hypothetical protein IPO15_27245 [Anaerolineae bacterium]|uniref:hypothetical protein n=1 Tax=Candidatus Amarolinea dominans TaxID=3140696 RepID=UPI003135A0D7|nr:hypothetical protein [Anaerolineae bacterium]
MAAAQSTGAGWVGLCRGRGSAGAHRHRAWNVPLNPLSIVLALAISGGGWFLVSWAIATAAVDVEQDLHEHDSDH